MNSRVPDNELATNLVCIVCYTIRRCQIRDSARQAAAACSIASPEASSGKYRASAAAALQTLAAEARAFDATVSAVRGTKKRVLKICRTRAACTLCEKKGDGFGETVALLLDTGGSVVRSLPVSLSLDDLTLVPAAVCCAIVCERHPMQSSTGHPSRRLRVPLYLYNTYSGSGSRHKTAKLWSCRQQQRRGECKEVLAKAHGVPVAAGFLGRRRARLLICGPTTRAHKLCCNSNGWRSKEPRKRCFNSYKNPPYA
jgi:hypothetical protein